MEFLVRAYVDLPESMPIEERRSIREREEVRGQELRERGVIRRIWRLPGQSGGIVLFNVADANELHDELSAQPLWPWMKVEVDALALHPLERRDPPGP